MRPAETTPADPLYTLSDLRRRYFARGAAPPKRSFVDWIERGQNGVFLDAVRLDGNLFVRASAFERFLTESAAQRAKPRRRFNRATDVALARCVELGVKLD